MSTRAARAGRTTMAAGFAAVLLLAACGGGDDADEASDEETTSTSEAARAETETTTAEVPSEPATSTQVAIEAAAWADGVEVEIGESTWSFTSDGIPDHERPAQYLLPAGTGVPVDEDDVEIADDPTVAQSYDIELPLEPVLADEPTPTSGGNIGVITSGATLFNPYEGDGTTVALASNITVDGVSFIDDCNGHPTPTGVYHYHGIPVCITDEVDVPGEHSAIVGVAFDGFTIYGGQGDDGDAPSDLDECLGHTGPTPEQPEGSYHYHLSAEDPFSLPCLSGTVDTALTGGGMGAPGGQGAGPPMMRVAATGQQAAALTDVSARWCSIVLAGSSTA